MFLHCFAHQINAYFTYLTGYRRHCKQKKHAACGFLLKYFIQHQPHVVCLPLCRFFLTVVVVLCRHPYSGYGDGRDGRPRSRSPMHSRESRDHRDGRDMRDPPREPSREPRPGPPRDHGPPREHESRDPAYRGSEGREKDPAFRSAPNAQMFYPPTPI